MDEEIKRELEKIRGLLENRAETLITVGQASEITHLSERFIRDIINEPSCPIVRIGRSVRIKRNSFISYLETREA